jgi:hypothetical protein
MVFPVFIVYAIEPIANIHAALQVSIDNIKRISEGRQSNSDGRENRETLIGLLINCKETIL